jgi:ABC-type sugar transport system permease subunit
MLVDMPFILVFSLFSAILLGQNFRGRTLARVLFFLPVIISTGVIATMESSNIVYAMMMGRSVASASDGMKEKLSAMQFVLNLLGSNLPGFLTTFLSAVIARLYDIITASGLQILIFLSGLHTISPALYEASNIEGATAWVNFWKITFPMLGPYILLNLIYTIIDSLTNMRNQVVSLIRGYVVSFSDFGYGLAISWIYFGIILLLLGLVTLIVGRRVFYHE